MLRECMQPGWEGVHVCIVLCQFICDTCGKYIVWDDWMSFQASSVY